MTYKINMSKQAKRQAAMLKRSDTAAHNKLEELLLELKEHPRSGTGKPEMLRGNRSGQWSRRITQRHRLVYTIDDDRIIVLVIAVAGHYD